MQAFLGDPAAIFLLIIGLAFSITFHEYMHGRVADFLGDDTARVMGRLTLNPIAHIDPFMTILLPALLILSGSPFIFGAAKPVPFNPARLKNERWGVAAVGLGGPVSNILLAAIFAAVFHLTAGTVPPLASNLLVFLTFLNIILATINMIPLPPLDGSRVLSAFLPPSAREAMFRLEQTNPVLLLFGVIFLIFFFWGTLIAPIVNLLSNLLLGFTV